MPGGCADAAVLEVLRKRIDILHDRYWQGSEIQRRQAASWDKIGSHLTKAQMNMAIRAWRVDDGILGIPERAKGPVEPFNVKRGRLLRNLEDWAKRDSGEAKIECHGTSSTLHDTSSTSSTLPPTLPAASAVRSADSAASLPSAVFATSLPAAQAIQAEPANLFEGRTLLPVTSFYESTALALGRVTSVEQLLGAAGLDLNDQPADFLPADCKEVLMTIWRPIASVQAMAALAPAGAVVVGMAAVFQCHMLALLASSLLCVDLMAQQADNERRFPGTTKPVKLLPVLSGRYNLKSSMGEWILVDGKWAIVGVAEKSGTVGPEVCFFELDKNGKPKKYDPFPEQLAGEKGRQLKETRFATIINKALKTTLGGVHVVLAHEAEPGSMTPESLLQKMDGITMIALALATLLYLHRYDPDSPIQGTGLSSLYAFWNAHRSIESDGSRRSWLLERSRAHLLLSAVYMDTISVMGEGMNTPKEMCLALGFNSMYSLIIFNHGKARSFGEVLRRQLGLMPRGCVLSLEGSQGPSLYLMAAATHHLPLHQPMTESETEVRAILTALLPYLPYSRAIGATSEPTATPQNRPPHLATPQNRPPHLRTDHHTSEPTTTPQNRPPHLRTDRHTSEPTAAPQNRPPHLRTDHHSRAIGAQPAGHAAR